MINVGGYDVVARLLRGRLPSADMPGAQDIDFHNCSLDILYFVELSFSPPHPFDNERPRPKRRWLSRHQPQRFKHTPLRAGNFDNGIGFGGGLTGLGEQMLPSSGLWSQLETSADDPWDRNRLAPTR